VTEPTLPSIDKVLELVRARDEANIASAAANKRASEAELAMQQALVGVKPGHYMALAGVMVEVYRDRAMLEYASMHLCKLDVPNKARIVYLTSELQRG
jgi:hypothetical protein